jgi:hypothetical protein
MNAAQANFMQNILRKRFKIKIKNRREAGRRGGIASQKVQREKRLANHSNLPKYPTSPRWSIGIRDNWSDESGWFTFISWRDTFRRLRIAMTLSPVIKLSKFKTS